MHSHEQPFTMSATTFHNPHGVVIVLAGDLDQSCANRLRELLQRVAAGDPARITVDLAAVTHFSCAALAELLHTRAGYAGDLQLVNISSPAARIITVLGLDEQLQHRP